MHVRSMIVAVLLCAGAGAQLHAQQIPAVARPDSVMTGGWSMLRVAKWTTALAAAGTAIYGFTENQRADREYERLEQVCVDEPLRCDARLPNGAYTDADLEARYQDVRAIDRRARAALVAGQIGVAASVVMFIIDLRNSSPPANIPYEPRTFEMMPARDGGVSLRMNVRLPGGG